MKKKSVSFDIFDPSSLKKAITELQFYQNNLQYKLEDALKVMGEEATDFCKPYFINFEKHEEEEAEMRVYCHDYDDKDKPGFQIEAVGQGVVFREFGAGSTTDSPRNPLAPEAQKLLGIEIRPGSFSETYMKQYSTQRMWHWRGYTFTGKPTVAGLHKTSEFIREKLPEIVKRSMD